MQSPPRELRRRIVPRWRNLTRTPTAELENHRQQSAIDGSVERELLRRVLEWQEERDVDSAQELVWASSAFGANKITDRSLQEVSGHKDLRETVRQSAQNLLDHQEIATEETELNLENADLLRQRIAQTKRRIEIAPHDPIQFVELARLYCQLGQNEQAKHSFRIAYGLAPSSRFVLRAATRFLVHVHSFDEAIKILGRGNQGDPWIQATQISVLDLSEKTVKDVKRARSILDSDIAPKHLSELAASLATLEFEAGKVSRAKRLFRTGAIDPNDNVIAQLHWAAQNKIREFHPELLKRSLTFEARASFAKKEKRWKDAITHCTHWIQDEPMSVRPAILGSYIASEMLQDHDYSIGLCEAGRRANPNDFTLLNNMAFNYAAKGDLDSASKFLDQARPRKSTKEEEVTFLATSGMIKMRRSQLEAGIADYNEAIDLAIANKLPMLAQLALVHYLTETAMRGSFLSTREMEEITKMMEGERVVDEVHDVYEAYLKPLLTRPPSPSNEIGTLNIPKIL